MASKSGQIVEPAKSGKMSGSVKVSAEDRFAFDIDYAELSNMKSGTCSSNTLKNNKWARWTFETWRSERSQKINVQTMSSRIKIQCMNGCVSL